MLRFEMILERQFVGETEDAPPTVEDGLSFVDISVVDHQQALVFFNEVGCRLSRIVVEGCGTFARSASSATSRSTSGGACGTRSCVLVRGSAVE